MREGERWLLFEDPLEVVESRAPDAVAGALRRIEAAVEEEGRYAAGFLAYEAAAAFGLCVRTPRADDPPLLWFGLFRPPRAVEMGEGGGFDVGPWQPSIDEAGYVRAVDRIRERIAAGDTYQVNYTMVLEAAFRGDPRSFFAELALAQRGAGSTFIDLGRYAVGCASPELFFQRQGEALEARPMKGTAPRGRDREEDERRQEWLRASPKNRAENLMIVDMLRNDLGRVAAPGTVTVPELFCVERYPTLLQMTSTVMARSTAGLPEVMEALFPCASVTGAPKIRTMEIIRDLETRPRGVYTGAVGHLAPGRQARFAVAIRTVVVDRQRQRAEFGVGSGIVWDSRAEEEYAECRLKARILTEKPFGLLESILWTPEEGFFLLESHLQRLGTSADHFAIPFDPLRAREALVPPARGAPAKVRLSLRADGRIEVTAEPLEPEPSPLRVGLAEAPVDSASPWLYHKTTRREVYDAALRSRPGCDEVLLWNERGELTEASRSNLVVDGGEGPVTPPVSCGLLPGTFRAHLLEEGRLREGVIPVDRLRRGPRLFLVNSVRLWREAVLV